MGLRAVTNELQTLSDKQEETTTSVQSVVKLIANQIEQTERNRLDALEAAAEAGAKPPIRPKGGSGPGATPGSTDTSFMMLPLQGLMTALRTLAIPAIIAVTASITGFDDIIRGLTLPRLLKSVGTTLKSIGNAFTTTVDGIKGLPVKIADAGASFLNRIKGIPAIIDNLIPKITIEAPKRTIPVPDAIKNFKLEVPDAIKNFKFPELKIPDSIKNFKFPELKMPDALKPGEGGFLKLPDSIKNFKVPDINLPDVKTIFAGLVPKFLVDGVEATKGVLEKLSKIDIPNPLDFLPRISFEIPPGLKSSFDSIKNFIGKAGAGAADAGSGILGFLGKLGGFARTIVAPLAKIVGIAFGPITVAILGIIDFFVGFFKGFTSEEGTFLEKLNAGIRGGLQGVIDGILAGFDTIFLKLPALILEFFGLQKAGEFLRSLQLGPIFSNVVNVVVGLIKTVTTSFGLLKDMVVAQFSYEITSVINGFKNAFTKVARFILTLGDQLYILISKNIRFAFPEVKVPKTFLTPEFTLIPGFDVGIGDESTRAEAQAKIDSVNSKAAATIAARNAETDQKLKELVEAQTAFKQALTANINDLSNNVSTSTTTTNNIGGGGIDVGVNSVEFVGGPMG